MLGRRVLATALGLAAALLAVELLLRLAPGSSLEERLRVEAWRRPRDFSGEVFEVDPEFGFRPRLDGVKYGPFGTRLNAYGAEPPDGVERLLFVGDSVTARGFLVDALRATFGEARFEYWNAGVESFNTVQELAYYRRYNAALEPDHVVLTFHPNDFTATPIVFEEGPGKLAVYTPHDRDQRANAFLYRHSALYRAFVRRRARANAGDWKSSRGVVAESLRSFRDTLAREGARFTVLVLPPLAPPSEWGEDQHAVRAAVLAITDELRIERYDLFEPLERALADGLDVQETPGDDKHPSRAVAQRFAAWLRDQGFEPGRRASAGD